MEGADRYDIVRKTQVALFRESGVENGDFAGLIQLFGPEVLASYLELNYCELEVIPSGDSRVDIAGVLDRTNRTVYVSRRFPADQRRLTGLHEIMHWMLHQHVGRDFLHRDRPVSFAPERNTVDWWEWEATHVACQYLMPEKLVRERFAVTFGASPLEFDENAAFYLNEDLADLRRSDGKQRAYKLAAATFFGRPIVPLHLQFKVSVTAMAIRLQELGLIAPDRARGRPILKVVR